MNKNSSKVTVLMPVHNGERYLRETIESILNQTYSDFEFLIINDGSTDKSEEIIKSYDDKRIRFVNNGRNLGRTETPNLGFDLAAGEYIVRTDCDDISCPTRLEKQVRFMRENPDVGICGSWMEVFGQGPSMIYKLPTGHEEIMCHLLFHNVIAHSSVIFRKSVLDKFKIRYSAEYKVAEDYELWLRAGRLTRLANFPESLLRYRIHQASTCFRMPEEYEVANRKVATAALSGLGIEFSKEELDVHLDLVTLGFYPDKKRIEEMELWLMKLLAYNKNNNLLADKVFSGVVMTKWLMACRRASRLGFWILYKIWFTRLWKVTGMNTTRKMAFIMSQLAGFVSRKALFCR
ncbi:MAG: glycosyltransferase [Candidatus Margulisiibacteriota bacterium]